MAKNTEKTLNTNIEDRGDKSVILQNITSEMRKSYLDYAMSVITGRALPDVRDGLKPVQRRILYAMNEMGLTSSAKFVKSARVVGEVLGKYHPHGDASVYETMVKMAQEFNYRYPLVIGQGNFGSLDGDSPAAMRYTEAKMAKLSAELLKDLDKETVEWRSNYDNSRKEPAVLPAVVPNLLLNGTLGIAVGMATSFPPHNLREVVNATVHLIENKDATSDDLLDFITGPDFPTGGMIFNTKDIAHAYATGRGGVVTRGHAEITEDKKGQFQIIITSLPYRVNKAELVSTIADLHREKKLEGIRDMRDESTKDIRVVIELKSGAQPQKVLNYIYKHTQLEEVFHFNMVALVDGVPQTLSLKQILELFISHRQLIVKRRTEFDLRKAEEREHILLGLKKALDHIDKIIALIKKSKDAEDAKFSLMKEFRFSDKQAVAILEMKLQRLAGLERKKVEDELKAIQELIASLKDLLSSSKKILSVIKKELLDLAEKYGDGRKTIVVKGGVTNLNVEDLIPEEENALVFTAGGYVKRTNPDEYKKQKRGGVGVVDLDTKEEDFVTNFLTGSSHSSLLFFSDKGRVYQTKMYDVPEGRRATRGKSIMNFLPLSEGEKVTSILSFAKNDKSQKQFLLLVTKNGIAKKVLAESFHDVRRSGLIAITLDSGDELVSTQFVSAGEEVIVVTAGGQSIRFKESDVRPMGRSAGGVRAVSLDKGDVVICAEVINKEIKKSEILVISQNGFGKKTTLNEYKVQKRGGSGIKTAKVTDKTGKLISAKIITGEQTELVAMSKKSQVIRLDIAEVPSLGRQTQGVRIMKLRTEDSLASLVCI